MLILYEDAVINLNNVLFFYKQCDTEDDDHYIVFNCIGDRKYTFMFCSEKNRDFAFDEIIESYDCKSKYLNLNEII